MVFQYERIACSGEQRFEVLQLERTYFDQSSLQGRLKIEFHAAISFAGFDAKKIGLFDLYQPAGIGGGAGGRSGNALLRAAEEIQT